ARTGENARECVFTGKAAAKRQTIDWIARQESRISSQVERTVAVVQDAAGAADRPCAIAGRTRSGIAQRAGIQAGARTGAKGTSYPAMRQNGRLDEPAYDRCTCIGVCAAQRECPSGTGAKAV